MKLFSTSSMGRRQGESALTLLELMVAMTLLTVVVLGLYLMFDRVQKAFRTGTAQVDVLEGGRSTVTIISRDLTQMRGVGSDGEDAVAGMTNSRAYINLYLNDDTPEVSPVRQRLLDTTMLTNTYKEILFLNQTNGTWTAVGYRLASRTNFYRPPTNGIGTLVRYEYAVTNVESLRVTNNSSQARLNGCPIYRFTTEGAGFTNDFQPVLDGVTGFDIVVTGANGTPFSNFTNAPPNFVPINRRLNLSNGDSTALVLVNSFMPLSVDFEMKVLEPQAADQVRGLPSILLQTNFLFQPEQAARVHSFRQRVPIRQGF